jgi:hypothetical protein
MKRILVGTLAAAAVSFSLFTLTSAAAQSGQQWAADRETVLHSRLVGMKDGLALRHEQEPLWGAFQSAVEGSFKSHADAVQGGQRMSPVDRVARGADERRRISEAVKPLYDSFDDAQKHNFELLGRDNAMREPAPRSSGAQWEFQGGGQGYSWEPAGWGE